MTPLRLIYKYARLIREDGLAGHPIPAGFDLMGQPLYPTVDGNFNLDNEKKMFDWASKQTYIALANMMTSAALVGIDSCPIEGFHEAKVNALLQEKFGVDTTKYGLSYMVAFGYRKAEPPYWTKELCLE